MTDLPPSDSAGPVAAEALRLAEAFAAWAGGVSDTHSQHADADRSADAARDDTAGQGSSTPRAEAHEPPEPGCGCGQATALDAVCRVCPVCRLAGLVQAIRPDVIDRVADLLAMVSGSLHEVASSRRDAAAGQTPQAHDSNSPAERHAGVDIPVQGAED
ncbi:hypothetical protein [Rudaeicoccus suwonensis]|uniref:hypothetical protein n=1 Tax=Rudaeicoccus suwonensis TaxID=657409 RepID=UPI0011A75FC9|nr:hypothetical protein [Rudaeicoccus suwonensis]